jgi:hypothetical protein
MSHSCLVIVCTVFFPWITEASALTFVWLAIGACLGADAFVDG